MKDTKSNVLDFWFQETSPSQWFQRSDLFDREISERFYTDYNLASDGVYDGWKNEAEGCLALCLLLDQFPRNMFRGSPMMFMTDEKALLIAKHAVAKGYDMMLAPLQRRFLYLPYEHSESLNDQKTCVKLFENMKDEDPVGYDYAVRHLDVIERFGRFPHRNEVLGRDTTNDEIMYLEQYGGF